MKFDIKVAGHAEAVAVSSEPGRVVVCGVGYMPHEARKIAAALARCATTAENMAADDLDKLQPVAG